MGPAKQTKIDVDAMANVRRAAAAYHEAERATTQTHRVLRASIVAALEAGHSPADVATAAGVSRQMVWRAARKAS